MKYLPFHIHEPCRQLIVVVSDSIFLRKEPGHSFDLLQAQITVFHSFFALFSDEEVLSQV